MCIINSQSIMYLSLPWIEPLLLHIHTLKPIDTVPLLIVLILAVITVLLHLHLFPTPVIDSPAAIPRPRLLPPSRDRIVHRIETLPPHHIRQISPPRIYKPIAYLQHGQVGLLRQYDLLILRGVRIESVLVQPRFQRFHRLLGQVTPALYANRVRPF